MSQQVMETMERLESDLSALYSKPFPSARTGALYNAFSYPTKISPEAIAVFIATHTNPGDTVLDVFGGSGTTGIGALLCDKPTETMKQLAQELGVSPTWGPRCAVLYELGVLGSFVSHAMCRQVDPGEFEREALRLLGDCERDLESIYKAIDPDGEDGIIRHVIWSDVLACPSCGAEITYWDAAVRTPPLRLEKKFQCGSCQHTNSIESVKRVVVEVHDRLLNQTITQKKRVPARIYGRTGKKTWQRDVLPSDLELLSRAQEYSLSPKPPVVEVRWGDLYRRGYHQGITHIHHFYTPRNLQVMTVLMDRIGDAPTELQDALRLLVLSYNASHGTLMTRVVVKDGQQDFVLTGAQSGVLYVSGLPVEKNIFEGLRRKVKTLKEAFSLMYGSSSLVEVRNASSTSLHLQDNSVDYVFTDPPFGDYIPYSELNQVNEAWLGRLTDQDDEIIVSTAQGKTVTEYGSLMNEVFGEISRVLKPSGQATVVFHSAKAAVWRALCEAYSLAGLEVKASSVLDKLQGSFKQVVSTVSVKGDPLLLLGPSTSVRKRGDSALDDEIISRLFARLEHEDVDSKERTVERLYSRYITSCLELGQPVSLDADAFYALARTRNGVQ